MKQPNTESSEKIEESEIPLSLRKGSEGDNNNILKRTVAETNLTKTYISKSSSENLSIHEPSGSGVTPKWENLKEYWSTCLPVQESSDSVDEDSKKDTCGSNHTCQIPENFVSRNVIPQFTSCQGTKLSSKSDDRIKSFQSSNWHDEKSIDSNICTEKIGENFFNSEKSENNNNPPASGSGRNVRRPARSAFPPSIADYGVPDGDSDFSSDSDFDFGDIPSLSGRAEIDGLGAQGTLVSESPNLDTLPTVNYLTFEFPLEETADIPPFSPQDFFGGLFNNRMDNTNGGESDSDEYATPEESIQNLHSIVLGPGEAENTRADDSVNFSTEVSVYHTVNSSLTDLQRQASGILINDAEIWENIPNEQTNITTPDVVDGNSLQPVSLNRSKKSLNVFASEPKQKREHLHLKLKSDVHLDDQAKSAVPPAICYMNNFALSGVTSQTKFHDNRLDVSASRDFETIDEFVGQQLILDVNQRTNKEADELLEAVIGGRTETGLGPSVTKEMEAMYAQAVNQMVSLDTSARTSIASITSVDTNSEENFLNNNKYESSTSKKDKNTQEVLILNFDMLKSLDNKSRKKGDWNCNKKDNDTDNSEDEHSESYDSEENVDHKITDNTGNETDTNVSTTVDKKSLDNEIVFDNHNKIMDTHLCGNYNDIICNAITDNICNTINLSNKNEDKKIVNFSTSCRNNLSNSCHDNENLNQSRTIEYRSDKIEEVSLNISGNYQLADNNNLAAQNINIDHPLSVKCVEQEVPQDNESFNYHENNSFKFDNSRKQNNVNFLLTLAGLDTDLDNVEDDLYGLDYSEESQETETSNLHITERCEFNNVEKDSLQMNSKNSKKYESMKEEQLCDSTETYNTYLRNQRIEDEKINTEFYKENSFFGNSNKSIGGIVNKIEKENSLEKRGTGGNVANSQNKTLDSDLKKNFENYTDSFCDDVESKECSDDVNTCIPSQTCSYQDKSITGSLVRGICQKIEEQIKSTYKNLHENSSPLAQNEHSSKTFDILYESENSRDKNVDLTSDDGMNLDEMLSKFGKTHSKQYAENMAGDDFNNEGRGCTSISKYEDKKGISENNSATSLEKNEFETCDQGKTLGKEETIEEEKVYLHSQDCDMDSSWFDQKDRKDSLEMFENNDCIELSNKVNEIKIQNHAIQKTKSSRSDFSNDIHECQNDKIDDIIEPLHSTTSLREVLRSSRDKCKTYNSPKSSTKEELTNNDGLLSSYSCWNESDERVTGRECLTKNVEKEKLEIKSDSQTYFLPPSTDENEFNSPPLSLRQNVSPKSSRSSTPESLGSRESSRYRDSPRHRESPHHEDNVDMGKPRSQSSHSAKLQNKGSDSSCDNKLDAGDDGTLLRIASCESVEGPILRGRLAQVALCDSEVNVENYGGDEGDEIYDRDERSHSLRGRRERNGRERYRQGDSVNGRNDSKRLNSRNFHGMGDFSRKYPERNDTPSGSGRSPSCQSRSPGKYPPLHRARLEPIKLPSLGRNKPIKSMNMAEFNRYQAEKKRSEALLKINRQKLKVDCHLDPRVMDNSYRAHLNCRKRMTEHSKVARENLKFLQKMQDPKSEYNRERHLSDFRRNYMNYPRSGYGYIQGQRSGRSHQRPGECGSTSTAQMESLDSVHNFESRRR